MRRTIEGTDEVIVSNGGLAVAGALMKSLKIGAGLNKVKVSSEEPDISNCDVFRSYLGLLLMGRTNYEDIELFRKNETFRWAGTCFLFPATFLLNSMLRAAE